MKKILFYCQHQMGIGHLKRCLYLIESLLDDFKVDLVQGGVDIGLKLEHTNHKRFLLTPLKMNLNLEVESLSGVKSDKIFELRQIEIDQAIIDSYDLVITELFPFGRHKFESEVLGLIKKVKLINTDCLIACSLRDILVDQPDNHCINLIEKYFHTIFVHSDKSFISLKSQFKDPSLYQKISQKVVYTGYIAPAVLNIKKSTKPKSNQIIISQGGGAVGEELLLGVLSVSHFFPDYNFKFITGPNYPQKKMEMFRELIIKKENCEVISVVSNLALEIHQSVLSLSLAGYNTMMDILSTQTKAIVYPFDLNHEQGERAQKLKDMGRLSIVTKSDLVPDKLIKLIKSELQNNHKYDVEIDLDGCGKFDTEINKILSLN